jgi:hypothetical protein
MQAGSQAPLQHIHAELSDIRGRNEAQQRRAEDLAAQRLAAEAQAKQVEAQIAATQAAVDRRLDSLPHAARRAYGDLLGQQAALLAEAGRLEEEAAELGARLAAAEGELGRNGLKQRALGIQVRGCGGRRQPRCRRGGPQEQERLSPRHATPHVAAQEQIRLLTQRKVELAVAEEALHASPEEQKEVRGHP